MTTYVIRNGELIEKHLAEPLAYGDPAFHYIADEMPSTLHMADGNRYTSKRKFRQATKDHRCIEVGDQANFGRRSFVPKLDKRQRIESIKQAIHQLSNGRH